MLLFLPIMFNIMLMGKLLSLCIKLQLSQKFYKDCFKIPPIMLALCLMLLETYCTQHYAGMIGLSLSATVAIQNELKTVVNTNKAATTFKTTLAIADSKVETCHYHFQ